MKARKGQVRRVSRTAHWKACVALAVLQVSRPALAQEAEVVRPLDLFDPETGDGVTLGEKLNFYPRVEADATYDSNIYNIDNGKIDDFVFSLRPRFLLKPDLARHEFSVFGGGEIRRYADVQEENSEQYDISARAALDFAQRTGLVLDGSYRHGIERRGTAGDIFFTDSPVEFDKVETGALLWRRGGFLELLGEVRIADINYDDATQGGIPIDLSRLDVTLTRARIRGSAPSTDHTRIFVEVGYNRVDYDVKTPVSRDSEGFSALVGMHLELSQLVDLEAGAGYIHQKFDNPAVDKINDINFYLRANWTPQPDVEVSANASRSVEPSPRPDIPALVRSDFNLEATKVFGDRLLGTVEVGMVNEKYQGFSDADQRYYAAARAHYRLTNNVGVIGEVSWRKQDGGTIGRDYSGVAATVGVRMHL